MYVLFIFVNYYIGVGKYIGKFWMKKSYNYNIIAYIDIYNVKLIIVLFINNINFHTVFKNQLDPTYLLLSSPISYIIFVDKTIYRVSFQISTPSKTTRPPTLIKTPRQHYH